MGVAPRRPKEGLKRGAWTTDEDKILVCYIGAHGEGKWRNIPRDTGLKRCGKSCRLRWLNYLRPDIKRGNISPEEEDLIVRLHKLLGNRWSLIAGRLPGRTDNEIKNYWNTILRKKLEARHKQSKDMVVASCEKNSSPETALTIAGKFPKIASIASLMAQPNPARVKSVSTTPSPSLDPKNNDIYRVELLNKEDNGEKLGPGESPSTTGSEQENELERLPMDFEFLASDFSEFELWKLLQLGDNDTQGDQFLLTSDELMNNYWKN